jgi:hypothetical protein
MPKARNKKKVSKDETPYPQPDAFPSPRGKQDGNNDAKGSDTAKKMMTKHKKHSTPANDADTNPSEQMDIVAIIKPELPPVTYPDSIDSDKYSTPIDLIFAGMSPTTDNWKYADRDEFSSNSPFLRQDIVGEEGTAYIFSQQIMSIEEEEAPLHTCHSVRFWLAATRIAFNPEHADYHGDISQDLRYLQLRMAVSDPTEIFTHEWRGTELQTTRLTCAWGSATAFFGSHYLPKSARSANITETIEEPPPEETEQPSPVNQAVPTPIEVTPLKRQVPPKPVLTTPPAKNKKSKKATFKPPPSPPPIERHATNPYANITMNSNAPRFFSKPMKDSTPSKNALFRTEPRKFETFLTIRFPKMSGENMYDMEPEILGHFQLMFDWMIQLDKKLVIYSWNGTNALKRGSEMPNDRKALETFTEGLYIQSRQSTWTRVLIGHDSDVEIFQDSDWAKEHDYAIVVAKLQVKSTCAVGWLLGSHRDMNATDLGSAIYASAENIKKFPIAIKFQVIRTNPGKLGKAERVIAAHIETDFTKASLCRAMLFRLYRSGNTQGYPLGIKMRFAPNTADIRQPVTIHTRQNVKILKNKQKIFLERTARLSSGTIQGLDYVEPTIGITLRQAVMDIRSQETKAPLFIAVNEETWSSRVIFLFPEDRMEEAVTLIPALPIIMAAQYGPKAWSWFNENAALETAGWFYDVDAGVVRSDEDLQTSAIVQEYDGGSDSDDEASPMGTKMELSFLTGGLQARMGQNNNYGDAGTITTAALQNTPTSHPASNTKGDEDDTTHSSDDDNDDSIISESTAHDNSLAPSGTSTWDVTSQASSRSTGTNKSITVGKLIKSLKKAMLHETPAVRVAINDAMAQLLVTNDNAKNAATAPPSGSEDDEDLAKPPSNVEGNDKVPNPTIVPPELLNGQGNDTIMDPNPPDIIPQLLTPDKRDSSTSNLNSATPSKTSPAKDGPGEDV